MRNAYDDVTLTGDGFAPRAPTLEDVDDLVVLGRIRDDPAGDRR